MTIYSIDQIEQIKTDIIGKAIADFYHEAKDDYFVVEFKDGFEISFRFMSDLSEANE